MLNWPAPFSHSPPSIVTFSPAQGRYVTTVSDSVPVRVIPRPDGLALSKRIQQLIDEDAASQQTGAPDWIFRWGFIVLMLLGLWSMHSATICPIQAR